MIARVLGRLAEGTTTVGALAAELGVDRGRLGRMLELLAHLGYLERVECGTGRQASEGCRGCAAAAACGCVADGEGAGGRGVTYVLTEKGRRAGGKSMSHEGHAGRAGGPGTDERAGDPR
jgi:hypothetical protein